MARKGIVGHASWEACKDCIHDKESGGCEFSHQDFVPDFDPITEAFICLDYEEAGQ